MEEKEWTDSLEAWISEINSLIGADDIANEEDSQTFPQMHRTITEEAIIEYARGIGDPNPLYNDREYAKGTQWGGMIAPQGRFIEYIAWTGSFPSGKLPRGVTRFYGGTKCDFYGVMRPGDEIYVKDNFLGIKEVKAEGKPYRLFTMESNRKYYNQRDELVCDSTGNTIITAKCPREGKKPAAGKSDTVPQKRRFTDDELNVIHSHYDDVLSGKNRRGALPLYWEDVVEGESVGTLIKGPLDIVDQVAFVIGTGQNPGASAVKWKALRTGRQLTDPETGDLVKRVAWHFSDNVARLAHLPFAMGFGSQNEAYICQLASDWMGDVGYIKHYECQHRRSVFLGDVVYVSGTVKRKYKEGDEYLVDLDISCANQDGVIVAPGSVTVKLPHKQ